MGSHWHVFANHSVRQPQHAAGSRMNIANVARRGARLKREEVPADPRIASAPSPIHGMGVFAQQDLVAGTEIPYNRSIGVNGINHSCRPNVVSRDTGSAVLRVTRPIAKGDEIVIDYLQWADRLVFGKCNCGYCAEVSRG